MMRTSITISALASIVAVVALSLLSVGLSHARAMNGNFGLIDLSWHRSGPNNQTNCNGSMSFRMNATETMHETMHEVYGGMHDRTDMEYHMGG